MIYATLAMSIVSIALSLWSLYNLRRIRAANERLARIVRRSRWIG